MELKKLITALFFPERCPYCGKIVETGEIACKSCLDEIERKHTPIVTGARGYRCVASFVYDGKVRRAVLRMKFHGKTQYIPQLASVLAEDIRTQYREGFDLITAVPMHKKDLNQRGYNQSVMLAKELSKILSVPYLDTLAKVKRTQKQHTLKYTERKTNLQGAFEIIDKTAIKGKRILIIDDIITSGYTLGTCCKVLSRAKPELICCGAVASAQNNYSKETVI